MFKLRLLKDRILSISKEKMQYVANCFPFSDVSGILLTQSKNTGQGFASRCKKTFRNTYMQTAYTRPIGKTSGSISNFTVHKNEEKLNQKNF